MKTKQLLTKMLLVAMGMLAGSNAAWGDAVVVPTPVYFNDFSFAVSGQDNISIVGSGSFVKDEDVHFGKVFQNVGGAERTNYLLLPNNVLSYSSKTKELSIGFWVNCLTTATDYYWAPMFTAYAAAPTDDGDGTKSNTQPMLWCGAPKLLQYNTNDGGWCDFVGAQNDNGSNAEGSQWLDDHNWHYYTAVFTTTSAKVYIDGTLANSWTLDNKTDGQIMENLFTKGSVYTYICLGGNQRWAETGTFDYDAAFKFDDIAIYNKALSPEQINQIRTNKTRNATGTKVGNYDSSTDYLEGLTPKVVLKPGDSYHYNFVNYNNGGYYTNVAELRINTWNNWILPVYDADDNNVIAVRSDNWEDKASNNTGCTSNFSWTDFSGNTNGATVDMTVTFTADKKFNMSSTITTVDGSKWNYSYTNDYTGSTIDLTGKDDIKVALSVSRSWLDVISEGQAAVGTTVTSAGWATLYTPYALDFSDVDGLTAYTASVSENTVTLTEVTNVPANTGVVLKGAENTYSIPVIASSSTEKGDLKGSATEATACPAASGTYYILTMNGANAEFNPATSGEIAAGKAYLHVGGSSRSLSIVFNDATGISSMQHECTLQNEVYNLQGQRVKAATKGLYIVNGKKTVIK